MSQKTPFGGRYDPHLPATKVIAKWGTNSRFARAIDKIHSTTARWLAAGYIPGEYQGLVIAAAHRDGIRLTPEDFVDLRNWQNEEREAALAAALA